MTYTNTQQKAPGATNATGLTTDTNASDSLSHGAIQQAPDTKSIATQIARLALAGHYVIKGDRGDYTVCKYGMTRYCADFAELAAFARQLGVNQ
jgi:hypothetical protein